MLIDVLHEQFRVASAKPITLTLSKSTIAIQLSNKQSITLTFSIEHCAASSLKMN